MHGAVSVVLRHDLPDGTSHIDWLLAPDGESELVSFRLETRPDELGLGEPVRAERIGDHRRLYLEHEGPLPGPTDRGAVGRLARGTVVGWVRAGEGPWTIEIQWHGPGSDRRQVLRLSPLGDAWWQVVSLPAAQP